MKLKYVLEIMLKIMKIEAPAINILWGATKEILRRECIAPNGYIRKERSQTHDLTFRKQETRTRITNELPICFCEPQGARTRLSSVCSHTQPADRAWPELRDVGSVKELQIPSKIWTFPRPSALLLHCTAKLRFSCSLCSVRDERKSLETSDFASKIPGKKCELLSTWHQSGTIWNYPKKPDADRKTQNKGHIQEEKSPCASSCLGVNFLIQDCIQQDKTTFLTGSTAFTDTLWDLAHNVWRCFAVKFRLHDTSAGIEWFTLSFSVHKMEKKIESNP